MATIVEYVLSLKDQLSGGIQGANAQVNKLESSLGGVKSMMGSVGSMLGTLGVGFAIFKGMEFVHEGVEAFHALEQVTAKVEANLEATGEKAGIGMKDITEMAKNLSSQVQFSRSEVMDMQSQLLTFPSITKGVFERSMSMVTDIAKQTGHGLSETAIMFGKAFNDPAAGLQKLMRYGVMFTQNEKDKITALQESGHLLEAQKTMLDAIAGSGYEGVAKKMFDADPLARYNKIMGSIKLEVGEAAMSFLKYLTPALEEFAKTIKSGIEFLKKHGEMLLSIIKAVLAGVIAFKAITLVIIPFYEALTLVGPAAATAAVGLEATGAAATLAMGPIGLLVAAIGGLVYAYSEWSNAEEEQKKHSEQYSKGLETNANEELDVFVESLEKKGYAHEKAVSTAKELTLKSIKETTDATINASNVANNAGKDITGFQATLSNLAVKQYAVEDYKGLVKKPKTMATVDPATKEKADTKSKATGSKSVTINVSIKDLIGVQNINTTNLKEGAGKIKDLVVAALTGAVNDFQVISGQ